MQSSQTVLFLISPREFVSNVSIYLRDEHLVHFYFGPIVTIVIDVAFDPLQGGRH